MGGLSWRDLLSTDESVVLPWTGGRALLGAERRWSIVGDLPPEPGWATFRVSGRRATFIGAAEAEPERLRLRVQGYLVGDRLVEVGARVDPDPRGIARLAERVHLVEAGLDRFVPVEAGRIGEGAPLVFAGLRMPSGPESEVLAAFLEGATSVAGIKGVVPALDAAFRMESFQRDEAARRRAEGLRRAAEAEAEAVRRAVEVDAERARAARRAAVVAGLGDGAVRRAVAAWDFGEAARAALAVGGAEYLDHRAGVRRGEQVVRYRFRGRRLECVCDGALRIVDAGVCLRDEETGERGDAYFTLESLPGVIAQADDEGVLVVFRHLD